MTFIQKQKQNGMSAEKANYFDLASSHSLLELILSHPLPGQLHYFLVM